MKHLILCILILALILTFSLWSVLRVSKISEHTASLLRQAQDTAHTGDMQGARQAIRTAADYWDSNTEFLCIVLQHGQVDTITSELAKLSAYADSPDSDDFFSTCAGLLSELTHFSQMELPLQQNIL